MTCEGIYADVAMVNQMEMTKGKNLDRKMVVLKLISEYKEFKRTHVQHFRFNSEASATMFGNIGKPIPNKI